MQDKFGKELHTGDLVAYGYRSGNTGGICLAIITNPKKKAIFSGGYQQGFGVSGDKLIKVSDSEFPEQRAKLLKRASKWLEVEES